jgi:CRP-like cAMP-binding protein
VFFLLEGTLASTDGGHSGLITAPAVVNLEEVLQGLPARQTLRAASPASGFRVSAGAFLTMVSDNVLMAQALFRLLLGSLPSLQPYMAAALQTPTSGQRAGSRLFRQDPLLAGATTMQLLALRGAAVQMPITSGRVLADADSAPAIFQLLQGEVRLESPDREAMVAAPGAIFGVAETLAGSAPGWRAVATSDGQVLRLDRDELFTVMADHVDLMQNLFAAVVRLRDHGTPAALRPEQPSFA